MKPNIPREAVKFYPPGVGAIEFSPGDFLLVSGTTFFDKLIRFGQSFRFKNEFNNKWTHAALIVNPNGELVEADGRRVKLSPLSKYLNHDYFVVRLQATVEDRHEVVNFALSCLDEEYGWLTILSIALSALTGLKFVFGFSSQAICSGLVARALERTSAIFPTDPAHITPSELARFFLPDMV